jgi:uncharacterized protein YcbK (DUF882 family)
VIVTLPNFTVDEVACPCGCGMMPTDEALIRLQGLRYDLDRPLIVTSGARCPDYNERIDGAENSRHMKGDAFDIAAADAISLFELVLNGAAHGFFGVGVAEGFVHLDLRLDEVMWTY